MGALALFSLGLILLPLNELIKVEKFFRYAKVAPAELATVNARLVGGSNDLSGVEGVYVLRLDLPDTPKVQNDTELVTIRLDSAEYLITEPDFTALAYAPTAPDQVSLNESFLGRHYGRIGSALLGVCLFAFSIWIVFTKSDFNMLHRMVLGAAIVWLTPLCIDFASVGPTDDIFSYVANNDVEHVRNRYQRGSADELRNIVGDTPLHVAAHLGLGEITAVLIEAGAKPNVRNDDANTPLILAVRQGHHDVAGQLLRAGAHPDFENFSGKTAIGFAFEQRSEAMVELLLRHGSDPSGGSLSSGDYRSQLRSFIYVTGRSDLTVWLRQIESLKQAVYANNVEQARQLLALGLSPNTRVSGHKTLLYHSALKGFSEMFKLLRSHGGLIQYPIIKVNRQDPISIRYAARTGGNIEIIEAVYQALPDLTYCAEYHRRFKNQAISGDLFCVKKNHLDS